MALILFFGDRLGLAFAPDYDLASFSADGVRYEHTGAASFPSLYDRLVDANGRFIGIQLYPIADSLQTMLATLRPRAYLDAVLAGRTNIYGVYFGGDVDDGAASTGDQAFGGQVFRGEAEELAVSIDLDCLCGGDSEASDLAAIRAAPVWWPRVADAVERIAPPA